MALRQIRGVFGDVAAGPLEVRWGADETIPISLLPEFAIAVERFIDGVCGEAFEGVDDLVTRTESSISIVINTNNSNAKRVLRA